MYLQRESRYCLCSQSPGMNVLLHISIFPCFNSSVSHVHIFYKTLLSLTAPYTSSCILNTPARLCRIQPVHGALPRVRTTLAGHVRKPAVRTPTPKEDPDAKQHATITNAWNSVSFFEPRRAMTSLRSRVWFAVQQFSTRAWFQNVCVPVRKQTRISPASHPHFGVRLRPATNIRNNMSTILVWLLLSVSCLSVRGGGGGGGSKSWIQTFCGKTGNEFFAEVSATEPKHQGVKPHHAPSNGILPSFVEINVKHELHEKWKEAHDRNPAQLCDATCLSSLQQKS